MKKRILNAILIVIIIFCIAILVLGLTVAIYALRNTEREIDAEMFEMIS